MNFDECFERVIGHEGGYENSPYDKGGETKYGISKRAYPFEDIKNLTLERARELYKRDYWGPAGCDAVPEPLRYALFDMSVNQGVGSAIKALQHAVGTTEDGVLGPKTLQAIGTTPLHALLFGFHAARLVAYSRASDDQWLRFGRGWVRRAADVMRA